MEMRLCAAPTVIGRYSVQLLPPASRLEPDRVLLLLSHSRLHSAFRSNHDTRPTSSSSSFSSSFTCCLQAVGAGAIAAMRYWNESKGWDCELRESESEGEGD